MLIAHIVYYVNNILLQGHTQPYTQALSCGGKSLVTLGGLSRLLCYVIIRVISVGNAPFWGNYYAIPRRPHVHDKHQWNTLEELEDTDCSSLRS